MKKRMLLGWCAVVVLIGGVGWKLAVRKPFPEQTALFATGDNLILKAVTYGTKHYPPGDPWRRLQGFIPEALRNKFKIRPPALFKHDTTSLACWFEWKDKPSHVRTLDCVFVDENDDRLGQFGGSSYSAGPSAKGNPIEGHCLTVFPRRQKELTLRVSYRDNNNAVSRLKDFKFPNPAYREYPTWTPETLPATKNDGDLEITLLKLGRQSDFRIATEASFRTIQDGRPTADWQAERIWLSDATGNLVQSFNQSRPNREGEETVGIPRMLWSSEAAWKLRVEFSRKATVVFATNELWIVRGLEVPRGSSAGSSFMTNWLGSKLEIRLKNGGFFARTGPVPRANYQIEVISDARRDDLRPTLVNIKDNHGRGVSINGSGRLQGLLSGQAFDRYGMTHVYGVALPSDVVSVDVTLALQISRYAEFVVKPPR
jgi:hypothetical protein